MMTFVILLANIKTQMKKIISQYKENDYFNSFFLKKSNQ